MKNKIVFLFVIAALVSACAQVAPTIIPGGKIVDASHLPTSFNESMKMQITTTEYVFIIEGNHSVKIGAETEILRYPDGKEYLRVVGEEYGWPIMK